MLENVRMNIDALHSALLSLTVLTEQIRSARDNDFEQPGLHDELPMDKVRVRD